MKKSKNEYQYNKTFSKNPIKKNNLKFPNNSRK